MKKILAIMMASMMALSMAACGSGSAAAGSSGSEAAPSASAPAESAAESSAPASGESTAESSAAEDSASGEGAAIATADDLKDKKIGVQAGTTGETYVTETLGVTPESFKSGMDAALDLKNGKIDAVVIDELPAKRIVEQNPDLTILDIDLATEEYAIAVKKGNTELLQSINATIEKLRGDGTYEALVDTFMPADGSEPVVPEAIPAGGDKTLTMGTNAAFPPFEYVETADPVGFDITMSQYIAQDFGAALKVEDMAFDSLISALQSGKIDMIAAGMSVTEERLQSVDFSDPYYSSKQVIILKK